MSSCEQGASGASGPLARTGLPLTKTCLTIGLKHGRHHAGYDAAGSTEPDWDDYLTEYVRLAAAFAGGAQVGTAALYLCFKEDLGAATIPDKPLTRPTTGQSY